MDGLIPQPAASWLLDSARQQTDQARTLLQQAGLGDWRGTAAVAYRQAVAGLLVSTTALHTELAEAARLAGTHERDLRAVQAEYGDAR